eukprot:204193-Pelagomonas_calceolata.AAC.7
MMCGLLPDACAASRHASAAPSAGLSCPATSMSFACTYSAAEASTKQREASPPPCWAAAAAL